MINKEREGADESMRDTCEKWVRHHKEFVISCGVLIAYILIGSLIRGMVHHFGYEFRSWLSTTAFLIFLVLVLVVLIYGIGLIFHLSKKLCQHKLLKIFLNLLIAVITAVIIVLAMNLVGSLLISALVIFPALSAMRIFKTFFHVTVCSVILSVICAVIGILLSIVAGTPVGSTIVATDIAAFFISCIAGKILRRY